MSRLGAEPFATHYHELTELEDKLHGIKNCVSVRKRVMILFLRKLTRGGADKSYGVEVAALAGIPDSVIGASLFYRILMKLILTETIKGASKAC